MKTADEKEEYLVRIIEMQDALQRLKDSLCEIQDDTCFLYELIQKDKNENA